MKKVFLQGFIIALSFITVLMLLRQVDWMGLFHVKEATDKTEEKLGELFWDLFSKTEDENHDKLVVNSIDSIVDKICTTNDIDRELIKVHILNKSDVNAFAFPDGHLIIFSGLIVDAENEAELSGVICHEMAHIINNHVMKKMVKEFGLALVISMTTGQGSEIPKKGIKMLSSTAFDRKLEKEADLKAIELLTKAKISPEPFADFLYKLGEKGSELDPYISWISTHPDSKERAAYILEACKENPIKSEPVLSKSSWDNMREHLEIVED